MTIQPRGSHPDTSPLSGILHCQPVTAPLAKISRASRAWFFRTRAGDSRRPQAPAPKGSNPLDTRLL